MGGTTYFNPDTQIKRAHSEYANADSLNEIIEGNPIAGRIAISSYTEILSWLGDADSTTRRMLEEILAAEEKHADNTLYLLEGK